MRDAINSISKQVGVYVTVILTRERCVVRITNRGERKKTFMRFLLMVSLSVQTWNSILSSLMLTVLTVFCFSALQKEHGRRYCLHSSLQSEKDTCGATDETVDAGVLDVPNLNMPGRHPARRCAHGPRPLPHP